MNQKASTVQADSLGLAHSQKWQHPGFELIEFKSKKTKYCLIVFVLNEQGRLQNQLKKMQPLRDLIDLVLADGGSTDGCNQPESLFQFGLSSLLIKRGSGKLGAQMRMAFAYAMNAGYEGVVVVDGNDKDDVAQGLPLFIRKLEEGFDHIQGSRFIAGGYHQNTPLMRFLGVRLLHAPLMSLATWKVQTDTTNGFRAYSQKLLCHPEVNIFRNLLSGYELHYHLAFWSCKIQGFKITEVPVTRVYPKGLAPPTKIKGFKGNFDIIKKLLWVCSGGTK